MTISYRVLHTNGYSLIEHNGQVYGSEDLCESIWLIQRELRGARLTRKEQAQSHRQIKLYQTLLDALQAVEA